MKNRILIATVLLTSFILPGMVSGAAINEAGPNNYFTTPMKLMPEDFTLLLNDDIIDSESMPWVSIIGTGNNTFDYYSFRVAQNDTFAVFDIDYAYRRIIDLAGAIKKDPIDTMLHLFDGMNGTWLYTSDNAPVTEGAGGSLSSYDPYFEYTFKSSGQYVVAVSRYLSEVTNAKPGELTGNKLLYNDFYKLQISLSSVEDHCAPIPLPASLWLLGSAMLILPGIGKRRKK